VLSDPKKRADYDAGGFAGVAGFTAQDLFGGIDFEDLLHGFDLGGFDFGGGGLFERFFGGHRRPRKPRGADIEIELAVPLARIATGGGEVVRVPRAAACAACGGTGAAAGTQPRRCEACHGSGRHVTSRQEGGVRFEQIATCADCAGRGTIIDRPCQACAGTGAVERSETLTIKVPAGIEEGTLLRIAGRGMLDEARAGPPGDLLVAIRSLPDPRFERNGADLWCAQSLSIPDAVLGAQIEVATLDGNATVRVPAGTQPDTVLRLRGKGLPRSSGTGRGDLLLRVKLVVPVKPSAAEKDLYRRLLDLQPKAARQ